MFRFGQERRASRLPCLSLALGDDRRSASGSGDVHVSLAIFITFVSGSESLASFTDRTFHFSGSPSFRMAFDAVERNGRFGRIQCQRSQESSSRDKRKRRAFLCRRTVRVKVRSKVIPSSILKIEGRGTIIGVKGRREGEIKEFIDDQNPGPKAPPISKKGRERREQRIYRGGATDRGAMEKSRYVRVIEGKEVRRDDPIEYVLPMRVRSTF